MKQLDFEIAGHKGIVKVVPTNSLKPSGYNPRWISDEAFAGLKKSIASFGLVDPIVVNKKTGNIISGHQRHKVLTASNEDQALIREVDLSEIEEKALNVTLNSPAISGDFTADLGPILDDIKLDLGGDVFEGLRMDELVKTENEIITPEIEFTEELFEEHNYVVLYFDNEIDWNAAVEKLGIKTVKALDAREGYERKGAGRVIRGDKIIDRLTD